MRPRENGQHLADDTFKRIFFNENVWISIKISLTFVPKGPIYNIPALVQIMAWCRPGDKPLSEPMMDSLPRHICVTLPQWINKLGPRQNGRHFADNIFRRIFLNENLNGIPNTWANIYNTQNMFIQRNVMKIIFVASYCDQETVGPSMWLGDMFLCNLSKVKSFWLTTVFQFLPENTK